MTPSPTIDRRARKNAALYVGSGTGGGEHVAINFLRPPRRSTQQMLAAFSSDGAQSWVSAAIVPASGDVDGDGAADLVLGQGADGDRIISDHIAAYRVRKGAPAELLDAIAAFPSGSSASGNLAVADVDPSVAGDEILVGEDGSSRRASVINVFGGLAEGRLRLLHSLRVVASRLAEHQPLHFVAGTLSSPSGQQEIAVAQRNGYVSIHTLSASGPVRLQRFHPFADQAETTAPTLAIGNILQGNAGNELVAAVPGRLNTGMVRIFDAMTGTQLADVSVFTPGTVRTSVSLWAADVIDALPGEELIIGQGPDGGDIVVYNLFGGSARRLFSLPGSRQRRTAHSRFLAIGDLIPNMAGVEVAIAQPDASVPIAVYHLTAQGATHLLSIAASNMATIGAIAAQARP